MMRWSAACQLKEVGVWLIVHAAIIIMSLPFCLQLAVPAAADACGEVRVAACTHSLPACWTQQSR
jgi:hypothetical protein